MKNMRFVYVLVLWMVVSAMPAICQTLDVVIEGPFLICPVPNPSGNGGNLVIWIPDLGDTHFVPAFSSYNSSYSLADQKNLGEYAAYDPASQAITLSGVTSAPSFSVPAGTAGGSAVLYRDKPSGTFTCEPASTTVDSASATASFKVPYPNSMYGFERAGDQSCVLAESTVADHCEAPPNNPKIETYRFATGVVLHYDNAQTPVISTTSGRIPFSFAKDAQSRQEIHLDVMPIPVYSGGQEHEHRNSSAAFLQASRMADKKKRVLQFAKMVVIHSLVRHNDCKAPIMLLCDTCDPLTAK